MYKHGDHYDGFIPMEHICDDPGEPLWQPGLTHDINAINNEVSASDKCNDSIMLLSTNGDGTEENSKDIIYRLQMHRKSNPANLIAGFLNINSIHNTFSVLQHILCNAYVDFMGVSET